VAYYEHLAELRNLADMRREFQVELGRLRWDLWMVEKVSPHICSFVFRFAVSTHSFI
jgi:hypothetical protein